MIKKEAEKTLKHKDPRIGTQHKWDLKEKVGRFHPFCRPRRRLGRVDV